MPSLTRRTCLALLVALPLAARGAPSILSRYDVERLHPRPMAECSLVVGCADAGPAGTFRLSLAVLASLKPLLLDAEDRITGGGIGSPESRGPVLQGRTGGNLLAAWAPWDGLEVHADLPVVVAQDGDDLTYRGLERPAGSGLGTPVVGARWTPWAERRGEPVTAALRLDLLPPLGSKAALAGNAGLVVAPAVELAHWTDDAVVAAEVGGILRGETVQLGIQRMRNELTWGVVAAGRGRPMWAEVSLRGNHSAQGFGLELSLAMRFQAGPVELYLLSGRGAGVAAGTPDLRFLGGLAWSGARGAPGASPTLSTGVELVP